MCIYVHVCSLNWLHTPFMNTNWVHTPFLRAALPQNMTGPRERAASNSSLPRYALCLDLAPRCKGGWLFNAIFASLSQARGTWQVRSQGSVLTEHGVAVSGTCAWWTMSDVEFELGGDKELKKFWLNLILVQQQSSCVPGSAKGEQVCNMQLLALLPDCPGVRLCCVVHLCARLPTSEFQLDASTSHSCLVACRAPSSTQSTRSCWRRKILSL